ncbi:MAG: (2Fe-2S)-binding protein [Spirochaetota bacterium]
MIVCSCANVNDRKVKEALHRGARTLSDLQTAVGVAMGCGRCREAVCEEISNHCGRGEPVDFPAGVVQPV